MNTRSSLYTAEIADHILGELRAGRSLQDICRDDGMPHRDTISRWVGQDHEGFAARYYQARETARSSPTYTGYSAETAERFLGEVMDGRSLVEVCGDPGMPDHTTVNRWVVADREGFAARYRSARQIGRLRHAAVPYCAEVANQVLDELIRGRLLVDICAEPDMPSVSAVGQWIRDDRDGFAERYRQAREAGCHVIAEQSLKIVDDRSNDWISWRREDGSTALMLDPERVPRAALRVKTRRWLLSKLLPRTFGERVDITARQDAGRDYESEVAEMMKLIDASSGRPPSENEPPDEK
jgi:hypothetical protein